MQKYATNRTRKDSFPVDDDKDETPDLRSLVLPWASMVIVAVIATAVVTYNNHYSDEATNGGSFVFETTDAMKQVGFDEYATVNESSIFERWLSAAHPVEQHHVHKPVYQEEHAPLFPLSAADRLGFSLAIIGLMVAAGGGIGGGGILVPIYILVMGFSPKHGTSNKDTCISCVDVLSPCSLQTHSPTLSSLH